MIQLRIVEDGDEAAVQRYASDPAVSATCNVPYPYPADGAASWLRHVTARMAKRECVVFAVTMNGEFAGVMTLNALNDTWAELDYWIAGPFQGKGVGAAAASLAVSYARDVLQLAVLFSACMTDNPSSARVLEKTGFRETARFVNTGQFGSKFPSVAMRRFRLDLRAGANEIRDPKVPT